MARDTLLNIRIQAREDFRSWSVKMKQAIAVKKMSAAEIEPVTSIYTEILHPSYISFSELAEGKAEGLGKLSGRATDIFREQLVALLDSDSHGFFVATVTDNIVGFALASLHQTEAGHIECWLDDIGVRHKWQKNGIGKALVEQVLDWGRQRNARYFLLESGLKNESAHHLFEHLGFQPLSIVFWRDRAY